ncbi:MAG: GAF domain-containing sensor histidine kinase [Burkholderiales bacterium]
MSSLPLDPPPTDTRTESRLRVVNAIGTAFLEGKDTVEVARQAVEDMAPCITGVRVNCFLRDGTDTFRVVHSVSNTTFPTVTGFRARASLDRMRDYTTPIVVADCSAAPPFDAITETLSALGTRAFVFAPLVRDGKAYGSITLGSPTPRHWTADEVALAWDVARWLSLGMQKARAEQKRASAESELRMHHDRLRQLVEERTRHVHEALERADRAKSDFLANMSHELRTPLHAILSFARIGRDRLDADDIDREKLRQHLDRILASATTLRRLVDNLISLSKLGSDDAAIKPVSLDVRSLLDAAEWEVADGLRARRQVVQRIFETSDLRAYCDRDRVVLALYHLLSNASKYAPEGSAVTVSVREVTMPAGDAASPPATPVPALEIAVADEGPGIPPAELESIFETFTQGSRTESAAGGRGLGLALCRQVARQHGCDVQAANHPGGGAVFTFRLPKEARPSPAADPMAKRANAGSPP